MFVADAKVKACIEAFNPVESNVVSTYAEEGKMSFLIELFLDTNSKLPDVPLLDETKLIFGFEIKVKLSKFSGFNFFIIFSTVV
jgi:hypothetical protein